MLLRYAYDVDAVDGKRFPYSADNVVTHINQMKEIWAKNADVIYAFQAGWVGLWGEWHNSLSISSSDVGSTSKIMSAFIRGIPPDKSITMRRDVYRKQSVPSTSLARVGFANDFFTMDKHPYASNNDYEKGERDYTAATHEGPSTIMDGEMPYHWVGCGVWCLDFAVPGLDVVNRLYLHGYSTFSYAHNETPNFAAWKKTFIPLVDAKAAGFQVDANYFSKRQPTAYELIRDFLGYRISLVQSSVPESVSIGQPVPIRLVFRNHGMSRPVNPRPIYLALVDVQANKLVCASSAAISLNARDIETAGEVTYSGSVVFNCPQSQSGRVLSMGVWMPDANGMSQADSRHAIRLANSTTVWFAPENQWGVNLIQPVTLH